MKKLLLSLAVVGLLAINGSAHAISVSFFLYNWEGAMKDTDGSLIKEDSRVELIWAGSDGIIDYLQTDPSKPNFLEPTGDDIVLSAYGVGEGLPPAEFMPEGHVEGHIEAWVGNLDLGANGIDDDPSDDNFYVRFYNAVDPVNAFFDRKFVGWGESDIFNIAGPFLYLGMADDVNFTFNDDIFITTVIPEPLTMITLFLSLIGIRFFNRKK